MGESSLFAAEAMEVTTALATKEMMVMATDLQIPPTDSSENTQQHSEITTSANSSDSSNNLSFLTDDEVRGSLVGYGTRTIEELNKLYQRHSQLLGFSIRKSTTRRSYKTRVLKEQYYVCSFQGLRKEHIPEIEAPKAIGGIKKKRKSKQQAITRSDCKVQIRVKLNKEGIYVVERHVLLHNHPLTLLSLQHYHRSERQIGEEKGNTIEALQKSGIGPTDSYRYMCAEAGGEKFVGHTYVDHMNFSSRLKMKIIEGKDSQSVINTLIQKGEDDPDFFYRVKLNEIGQVSNIFWRDAMMKEDYEVFGDVCVFDTTY